MLPVQTSLALTAFIALFTIINPFSTASVFLTIARGASKSDMKYMAQKASLTAAIVLTVFAFAGQAILSFFGITIPAFLIAGGIIISVIGFNMIQAKREAFGSDEEKKAAIDKDDVSIIPLAIPMLSGPGAITTTIVLTGNNPGVLPKLIIIGAIAISCLISYIILANASILEKHLGKNGQRVIDRLMGLLVMVIGIQYLINGITAVFLL